MLSPTGCSTCWTSSTRGGLDHDGRRCGADAGRRGRVHGLPGVGTVGLLLLAALVAGYLDAVVGGGGLIQLPMLLLLLPGALPIQILATNKLSSICGTTSAP